MNIIKVVLVLSLSLVAHTSSAQLKDPMTRDENISNTVIKVGVAKEGDLYRYKYTIEAPTSNLGTISRFLVDLSCDVDFGDVSIPVDITRVGYLGDKSRDGMHVPAELFADYGTSNTYGITKSNYAMWTAYMPPGTSKGIISILSTQPPGERSYILVPLVKNDPSWDYSLYEEGDPNLPWIDDFTITSTTTGPACHVEPNSEDLFKGTGKEPFEINNLLQYENPVSDPTYVKSNNEAVTVTIHYAKNIQKQSFKAKLNGNDISKLFNPKSSTNETVTISGPWKSLNKLKLSVLGVMDGRVKGVSQDMRPEQSTSTPAQVNAARGFDEFKSKDVDTFHIWIKK